jgi:hypothetical protein
MSDTGEVEVENPSAIYPVLPKDVQAEVGSVKLFNKWSYEDVEIRDISLTYVSSVDFVFTWSLCGFRTGIGIMVGKLRRTSWQPERAPKYLVDNILLTTLFCIQRLYSNPGARLRPSLRWQVCC